MKFIIEYEEFKRNQVLEYLEEEHSFYMGQIIDKIDVELIINKIALEVSNSIIVHLSGFCGLNKTMVSNYKVPKYKRGLLRIESILEFGLAYNVHNNFSYEYPVYINIQSGWVCIGSPKKEGHAVEFINNCVAVINNNKEFVSLWLKPKKLPVLL